MNGVLSETRMREIVLNNPIIGEMRNDIQEVRELLIDLNDMTIGAGGLPLTRRQSGTRRNVYETWVVDNMFRRLPPDWQFPQGPVLNVYQYRHHGDTVQKISPLKNLEQLDVSHFKGKKKRYSKNLEEVQFLFSMLDKEAHLLGVLPGNAKLGKTQLNHFTRPRQSGDLVILLQLGRNRIMLRLPGEQSCE